MHSNTFFKKGYIMLLLGFMQRYIMNMSHYIAFTYVCSLSWLLSRNVLKLLNLFPTDNCGTLGHLFQFFTPTVYPVALPWLHSGLNAISCASFISGIGILHVTWRFEMYLKSHVCPLDRLSLPRKGWCRWSLPPFPCT